MPNCSSVKRKIFRKDSVWYSLRFFIYTFLKLQKLCLADVFGFFFFFGKKESIREHQNDVILLLKDILLEENEYEVK